MSHVHENGQPRGLDANETERNLQLSNFTRVLEHFRKLEDSGEVVIVGITIPEVPHPITEVTVFVAPPEDIKATEHSLNGLLATTRAGLLTTQTVEYADHLHRGNQFIPEELRLWIQDDSLYIPALIFDDQLRRTGGQLRVQDSDVLHDFRLENCEKITTTFSLFPNQRLARLAQESLPLLSGCRGVYVDNRPVYKVFRYLVGRVIQTRHARQINEARFKIADPAEYLRDIGIPLTQEEAERLIA